MFNEIVRILESRFFRSIENSSSQRDNLSFLIRSIIKVFAFVQLLHILHINQQSHIIFTYLVKIVEQNERFLTLQKWQKSTHYRRNSETSKISSLSNLCQIVNWNVCENLSLNSSIASHLVSFALQSTITYDFHLTTQNRRTEWAHLNASRIIEIYSLSQ